MIAETIANYMFVNIANDTTPIGALTENDIKIHATQAFGLFVMIQGL